MKKGFLFTMFAMSMIIISSCANSTKTDGSETDSGSTEAVVDSIVSCDDNDAFKTQSAPSGTEEQSEGFGRCSQSGCYCKEFEGRGQTCRNCGHAYSKHY